jgi:hypothetical protein
MFLISAVPLFCLKHNHEGVSVPQTYCLETVLKYSPFMTGGSDWKRKMDFSAGNTWSSCSTAGKSGSHIISQWHNRCLCSLTMKPQISVNDYILKVYTEYYTSIFKTINWIWKCSVLTHVANIYLRYNLDKQNQWNCLWLKSPN